MKKKVTCYFPQSPDTPVKGERSVSATYDAGLGILRIDIAENPEPMYKVTLDDAQNMLKALKFNEYSEIRPVEKGGDTLLYVVTSDNGWLVIAGDKRVYPIVAESEKEMARHCLPMKRLLETEIYKYDKTIYYDFR